MSAREVAAMSDALLVAKGAAAPLRLEMPRVARVRQERLRRVSVRLDEGRHRRLRLAAAHLQKSVQAVLIEAIEQYLNGIVPGSVDPSCGCLARCPAPESAGVTPFRLP